MQISQRTAILTCMLTYLFCLLQLAFAYASLRICKISFRPRGLAHFLIADGVIMVLYGLANQLTAFNYMLVVVTASVLMMLGLWLGGLERWGERVTPKRALAAFAVMLLTTLGATGMCIAALVLLVRL